MDEMIIINLISYLAIFIAWIISLWISYRTTMNNSKLLNVSFKDAILIWFLAYIIVIILLWIINNILNMDWFLVNLLIQNIIIWIFIYFILQKKIDETNKKIIWLIIRILIANILLFIIINFVLSFILWIIIQSMFPWLMFYM